MKLKRILLSVLLPLALAAAVLAVGTLAPTRLLQRLKQTFLRESASVPAGDVRPYGDDYETMKDTLRQSIQLARTGNLAICTVIGSDSENIACNSEGIAIEEYAEYQVQWEDLVAAADSLAAFLTLWNENLIIYSYWMDNLAELYELEAQPIAPMGGEESWLLQDTWYDLSSSAFSYMWADPSTGVPLLGSIDTITGGYISPQALWDALTAAYQSQCGLTFNAPVLSSYNDYDSDAPASTLDEGLFQEAMQNGYMPRCSYSAVSTDFTFRLTLNIYYFNIFDNCKLNIEIELTDNAS